MPINIVHSKLRAYRGLGINCPPARWNQCRGGSASRLWQKRI